MLRQSMILLIYLLDYLSLIFCTPFIAFILACKVSLISYFTICLQGALLKLVAIYAHLVDCVC